MILRGAAPLLALLALPVAAQDGPAEVPEQIVIPDTPPGETENEGEAPASVPRPEDRPAEEEPAAGPPAEPPATEPQVEAADPASLDSVPVPPARPEDAPAPEGAEPDAPALIPPDETTPSEDAADPAGSDAPEPSDPADAPDDAARDASPAEPTGPPMREVLTEAPEDLAACLADLDELRVVYEQSEPISDPGNPDCGIANPVTVTEIAPGVALEPPPTLRCETALAAARWAQDVAIPLARKLGRGDLVAIDQGTATLCRPRADGEMSEHAWGNALDVMGFRFSEGEPIPVEPRAGDGTLDEAFQRAVRSGACLDFRTVLGPGSDADHADHLHFDIRERDGGFRICE